MRIQCQNCFKYYVNDAEPCPSCGYVKGACIREGLYMNLGSILHKRYRIGRILTSSDADVTYLAWDMMLETKVVIREYLPKAFSGRSSDMMELIIFRENEEQFKQGMERFMTEAKLLEEFQNEPGIIRIFESFMENNTAYIAMEYLEGVTLTKYLEQEEMPKPEYALVLITAVIRVLEAVYKGNILQCDTAPENILITKSGEVKLMKL